MKRKISILVFFWISTFIASFAESYYFENKRYVESEEISFVFKSGVFSYHNSQYDSYGLQGTDVDIPITLSGSYKFITVSGFLVADVEFQHTSHRLYIFFESKNIVIYDTVFKRTFFGTVDSRSEAFIFPVKWVKATSHFTEVLKGKEISYTSDNLSKRNITKPWVEGVKGDGVGEVLRIGRYSPIGTRNLLILNGFFSPNQPELYWDNGRLKKINLKGFDNEGNLIYEGIKELSDKPELQLLTSVIPAVEFEIEILEVYPGRRFQDTAVSGIFHDELRYMEEFR